MKLLVGAVIKDICGNPLDVRNTPLNADTPLRSMWDSICGSSTELRHRFAKPARFARSALAHGTRAARARREGSLADARGLVFRPCVGLQYAKVQKWTADAKLGTP